MATPSMSSASSKMSSSTPSLSASTKALASRASNKISSIKNSPKTKFATDFATEFGKNLGKTGLEIGKSILRSPLRVGTSLAEIPRVAKSGGSKTFSPYKVPFLGEIKTYSRDAQDKIGAGDGSKMTTAATIAGVGGNAILDTVALGSAAQGVKNKLFSNTAAPKQAALTQKISGGKPTVSAGGKNWTVDDIHNTSSTALKKLSPADYKKLTDFDVTQSRSINFQGGRKGPVNLLDSTPTVAPTKTVNVLNTNYKPSSMTPSNELLGKGRAYSNSVEKIISDEGGWGTGVKTLFDSALMRGDKLTVKALLNQKAVPANYLKTFSKEINNILK